MTKYLKDLGFKDVRINKYKKMSILPKRDNILFLEGVYLEDCDVVSADRFDIEEEDEIDYEKSILNYNKIPETFTGKDSWPMSTNIKCWHCDRNFAGIPLFIPLSFTKRDNKVSMKTYGNFCSPHCAAFVVETDFTKAEIWEKHTLIQTLVKILTGETISVPIPAAPKKTIMIHYGGNKTADEYKNILANLNRDHEVVSLDDLIVNYEEEEDDDE